ncbi:hypothetical protein BG006_000981 [Podila minutissima]|uniref:Uncharacterized protein n=1 Tax=Podila minutissima TaxID=64525 RepID=A0A9P5SDB0_9FUNG|nr:hypothetical protein BG006_000981 [Podila minutissima]
MIIDEPFVFQAPYNYIQKEDKGFYKHFREYYRDLQDLQSEGKIFARHAPLDLIYAFHKKPLKQQLFAILKAAKHRDIMVLKTPILAFKPVIFPDEGDSAVPPFYYPESSHSGPDIVFVLQIDNQLYPVFLQTKLLDDISPGKVEDARLTVHETKLKVHVPNLTSDCLGGKYLSLIYIHPMIIKMPQEGWDGETLWDMESEAGTNRNQDFKDGDLMQLLMILDGSNMRNFLPPGVVELL